MLEMKNPSRYSTDRRIVRNIFHNDSIRPNSDIITNPNIPDNCRTCPNETIISNPWSIPVAITANSNKLVNRTVFTNTGIVMNNN